ncbi:MAG: glycosyltransferase, partial [Vicinamibacteria bacterium]
LAVVEAFRAGVPVVASRIPALSELVEEGATGWLFDPDDAASLARAADAVLACPTPARQAVTARARARFEDRYTLDQMLRGYADVYDQLMRKAAA